MRDSLSNAALRVLTLALISFSNDTSAGEPVSEVGNSSANPSGTVQYDSATDLRPRGPDYVFIGDFKSGNPFKWDNETISNPRRGRFYGLAFELNRGGDIEIRDITVTCRRGRICFSDRGGDVVSQGRPLQLFFRNGLDVVSVSVRAKPTGLSIPPPRVNVYLEQ